MSKAEPSANLAAKYSSLELAAQLVKEIELNRELVTACEAMLAAHTPYMIRKACAAARAAVTKQEEK
jgi:hypothetical protein